MAEAGKPPSGVRRGSVAVVIPARYGSTRLPGKPLLEVAGKPIIQYVWERARACEVAGRVVVATDDERILAVAKGFGAEAFMTGKGHASGTDRIAELVRSGEVDADVIVNVQGDEPEIEPASIDLAARMLLEDAAADISTLAVAVRSLEEYSEPNAVKAVIGGDGYALYFSRAAVPFVRDGVGEGADFAGLGIYRHVGLYAYRREALLAMTAAGESDLERLERLEQLRALELGLRIKVGVVEGAPAGIDTEADLRAFAARMEGTRKERKESDSA